MIGKFEFGSEEFYKWLATSPGGKENILNWKSQFAPDREKRRRRLENDIENAKMKIKDILYDISKMEKFKNSKEWEELDNEEREYVNLEMKRSKVGKKLKEMLIKKLEAELAGDDTERYEREMRSLEDKKEGIDKAFHDLIERMSYDKRREVEKSFMRM